MTPPSRRHPTVVLQEDEHKRSRVKGLASPVHPWMTREVAVRRPRLKRPILRTSGPNGFAAGPAAILIHIADVGAQASEPVREIFTQLIHLFPVNCCAELVDAVRNRLNVTHQSSEVCSMRCARAG